MYKRWFAGFIGLLSLPLCIQAVSAQVVPDSTLGAESSVVTPTVINGLPSDLINGGAIQGSNLFHSFQEFSIATGRGAYFTNPVGITTIFSRVTGGLPSNINGTLGVLGSANLFLLNPQGILFGPSARLDVSGGSLYATTARQIEFADGTQFRATPDQPLLTMSAPVGLGFLNPGPIQVQGNGHTLALNGTGALSPFLGAGQSSTGLRLSPGANLFLLGGDTSFNGGVVTAPSGNITITAVASGRLGLNSDGSLQDSQSAQLQNIRLERLSLLDTSGLGGGNIFLKGRNISLSDGSFALIQNQGTTPAGRIDVVAESLTIRGATENPVIQPGGLNTASKSGLVTDTFAGDGASVRVTAHQLALLDGGGIRTTSFGNGRGGSISVTTDNTLIAGYSPLDPVATISLIQAVTFGSGKAGNFQMFTGDLQVRDGAQIGTGTAGAGQGGVLRINANRFVLIDGANPVTASPSLISSGSVSPGKSNNTFIQTPDLTISNGGQLSATALSTGEAGNVFVEADRITVQGYYQSPTLPSLIAVSNANTQGQIGAALLDLPVIPASSGNITLNTRSLVVSDFAQILTANLGQLNAGDIAITAKDIQINHAAQINAVSNGGQGGNITMTSDRLILRSGQIAATAGGNSQGGNIKITTGVAALLGESSIQANAEAGMGGTVFITAKGIFISPQSSITATSALGPQFDGVVQISTPAIDLTRSSVLNTPTPDVPAIDMTCRNGIVNRLTISGTGGLPISPDSYLTGTEAAWRDPSYTASPSTSSTPVMSTDRAEATGWVQTAPNRIRLVARNSDSPSTLSSQCLRSSSVQ